MDTHLEHFVESELAPMLQEHNILTDIQQLLAM